MAKDFWSSFFSSPEKQDPMASIRQQLQALQGRVSGFVGRQKALTAEDIAQTRKRGMENIGEGVYSQRGWGRGINPQTGQAEPGSIYSRLSTELEEKLAREKSRADLASEMAGFGMESDILGQLSGMPEPEDTYEPSPFMNLLSQLISSGVSAGTQGYVNRQSMAGLGDWASRLSSIKPTQTYSSNDSGYSPEFLKMMEDYRKMRA